MQSDYAKLSIQRGFMEYPSQTMRVLEDILHKYKPDVIVTNNCAAEFANYGRLIMDDTDLYNVYKACPDAKIIASHMDNVPHATLTRKTLREKLEKKGIVNKILIPEDGEAYTF